MTEPRQDQRGVSPDQLQRLWAPWRFGYIVDENQIEGCPFCVLPERGDDRANLILLRGEHNYVIFNAYPYNPGHLMVVPFAHVGDLGELDDEAADELWRLGRQTVSVLSEALASDGINLGMNLGGAAGAGIAEHLHLHVVPRWEADTNFVSTIGATRVLPRALEEMFDELVDAFNGLD
ncbi:MAG: HIT domain-containing protein [Nitriliruptorales bacterium]|nr:HIT domain-containing protein [Nitriliruptorales bacterium]